MSGTPGAIAPLAPVLARLRRRAADEAARIRADARREAAEIVAQARLAAQAALSRARAAGQADAAPLASAELSRSHSEARSALLHAQREAGEELRRRVRDAVGALPAEPGYAQLAEQLTRMVRLAAGPDAKLTPGPGGGVIARAPGVIVDCSLTRLADLAVDSLGADVRELWTP